MDDYKEHLRRLAVHDDAFVGLLLGEENTPAASALDPKTAALVRVAATIAVDAAPSSFQHAVALALAAGATSAEIVATLEAVTPVTGAARVVRVPRRSRSRSATTSKKRSNGSNSDRPPDLTIHLIGMRNAESAALIAVERPQSSSGQCAGARDRRLATRERALLRKRRNDSKRDQGSHRGGHEGSSA